MEIGFLLFPHVTQLDFTGPIQVFQKLPRAKVHVVAKTKEPIPTDCGFHIVPTCTFQEAPTLDLLCIPGGFGVSAVFQDPATLEFVSRVSEQATWLTSVCTGAFVLGKAGLLQGRKATTHWAYRHLLPQVGAVPVEARVVRDGHVWTGGGVTAGIDFALTLVSEIDGIDTAQGIQLALEYDPAPPQWNTEPEVQRKQLREQYQSRIDTFSALLG
ncbi:MAG: DJ-1/PfpI family protein [Deltaproteobacteria bacterium]|nr:MAG: DJ-1/PfpI family protein [Deltaproteobacteria bacterium]